MSGQHWALSSRTLFSVWAVSFALGIASTTLASLIANKKCYDAGGKCGGWLDSVCEGQGSFCSYCSGGSASGPICFNKPESWCRTQGNPIPCGKVVEGSCGANGYCSNTSVAEETCYVFRCPVGAPPPPPPV
jgi:hypothetical protein